MPKLSKISKGATLKAVTRCDELPISLARDNLSRSFVHYSRLDAQLGHPQGEHETGRTGADNEHIDLGCFYIGSSARCSLAT